MDIGQLSFLDNFNKSIKVYNVINEIEKLVFY